MEKAKGKLYLVATPIGNLEDVTVRALSVLRNVSFIAAEDTRRTRTLLTRYGISRPLVSYHDFNKRRAGPAIVGRMLAGEDCALVSDAGSPCISDPGYLVVNLSVSEGIEVVSIPGPSSIISALQISGLPTDRFAFEGYLPKKGGKRLKKLRSLASEERTIVVFESPNRASATLGEMLEAFGDRRVAICRELTKVFEEVLRLRLSEASERFSGKKLRGEVVLVVEGNREGPQES
ncbi:MAG: 16S rRNA (cytidine(1402)-2'-O)-methyltransferase [Candidatus Eisenbacteria bacterium]